MEGFRKMKEYKICSKCGQKKVGSRNAWFQDFTDQPLQCNRCINKERGSNFKFSWEKEEKQ